MVRPGSSAVQRSDTASAEPLIAPTSSHTSEKIGPLSVLRTVMVTGLPPATLMVSCLVVSGRMTPSTS